MNVYRRTIELMEAEIGDELVALDPNAGQCFGFNGVATSIWRELESPKSFDQLKNALLDQYDVAEDRCSMELQELLDDLVSRNLVTKAA